MGKRVLVTGAAGFVGANLVRILQARGHEVLAVVSDRNHVPRLSEVPELYIREPENGNWIRESRAQWVFHLAASGAYSWQTDSAAMVEANVSLTARLLEWTDDAEVFVYAGSSSEYGLKDHAPREDEFAEPNSVYAATKLAGTALCQQAGHRFQRPTISARLYSVYGPFEDPRRLIPTVVREGLRGRLPQFVHPAVARDFVHSEDVCEALLQIATFPGPDCSAIFNVGSGVQTTVMDVAMLARATFQILEPPKFESMPNRSWDTNSWVSDCKKIEREIGWKAKRSLDQGFLETADWYRAHPTWLELGAFESRGAPS